MDFLWKFNLESWGCRVLHQSFILSTVLCHVNVSVTIRPQTHVGSSQLPLCALGEQHSGHLILTWTIIWFHSKGHSFAFQVISWQEFHCLCQSEVWQGPFLDRNLEATDQAFSLLHTTSSKPSCRGSLYVLSCMSYMSLYVSCHKQGTFSQSKAQRLSPQTCSPSKMLSL